MLLTLIAISHLRLEKRLHDQGASMVEEDIGRPNDARLAANAASTCWAWEASASRHPPRNSSRKT